MCKRNFTGPRDRPAADEPGLRYGVVRRLERTLCYQSGSTGKTRHRMDLRDLESFLKLQRRQDRRQTFSEHRLSGTGWADEQDIVPAGACNLERALCRRLTSNFGEVTPVVQAALLHFGDIKFQWLGARGTIGADLLDEQGCFSQISNRIDVNPLHNGRLARILFGQQQTLDPAVPSSQGDRQSSADRANAPIQGQFPYTQHMTETV